MKTLGTYRFKDKDPVIDIVRTCVEIFAVRNNVSFGRALTLLERSSGVSKFTMRNWFDGDTISPKFCNVAAVVHATGRRMKIGDKVLGSTPRFRVVQGRKSA